jgi:heme A synthase
VLDAVKFVHTWNARFLVGVAVGLALWASYSYLRRINLNRAYLRAWAGLFGLTALQGLLGIGGYLLGGRPGELVHVAYGIFALIFVPAAYFASRPGPDRGEAGIFALAGWIVAIVYIRGIVTG